MATGNKQQCCYFGNLLFFSAFLYCVTPGVLVRAAEPISWKIGADFSKAMQSPVGFTWSERALREGLGGLSKEYRVAIWLDRRIDPDQKINIQVSDIPLQSCFSTWASERKCEVTSYGSMLVILPRSALAKLIGTTSIKRAEIAKLTAAARTPWLSTTKLHWEDATEPRALLGQLTDELRITCSNPQALPHDLWPAWQGPPLARYEWLTLLLNAFDLSYELDATGSSFKLVPIPTELVYEHLYTVKGDVLAQGKMIKQKFPHLTLRREGTTQIGITASTEEHEKLAEMLGEKKPATTVKVKPGLKTYTLTVQNQPRGAILKTLSKELGVELKYDEKTADKLSERVNLTVKQVSAEALLQQLLAPAELQFELTAEHLHIRLAD
jgi:hypothetical protein